MVDGQLALSNFSRVFLLSSSLPQSTTSTIDCQPLHPSEHSHTSVMNTSGYDLKAWQTYYESQGYDTTTAASYAYYAYQQALAASSAPLAGTSGAAYGGYADSSVASGSTDWYNSTAYNTVANSWDPEAAQQQSAYSAPDPNAAAPEQETGKIKGKRTTVIRKGGGKMWDDPTLAEWDPKWFRLFVSDVSNDCTEKVLTEAFDKYKSFQKARVVKDRLSNKSKYAFLAFSDPEDFLLAWKQMDGKYVGNRPIRLSKATTSVRTVNIGAKKAKMFDNAPKTGIGLADKGRVL